MCAMMYPQKEDITDLPFSERAVYEFLEKLGDGYVIFHSVQWMKRSNKWKSTWKENDFLILHRKLGALVLEVKGGDIAYRSGAFNQINQATTEVRILSEKKRNDPLSQAIDGIYQFAKIVDMIAADFELITAPGAKKNDLERAFLKLTNEQTGLLDYISEQNSATIQGAAGTGKTLIAKEAARRFGSEGRKVLFLCFNRMLFRFLSHMYPYENVSYYNIHTFIAKYATEWSTLSSSKDRAQTKISPIFAPK